MRRLGCRPPSKPWTQDPDTVSNTVVSLHIPEPFEHKELRSEQPQLVLTSAPGGDSVEHHANTSRPQTPRRPPRITGALPVHGPLEIYAVQVRPCGTSTCGRIHFWLIGVLPRRVLKHRMKQGLHSDSLGSERLGPEDDFPLESSRMIETWESSTSILLSPSARVPHDRPLRHVVPKRNPEAEER